MGTRGPSAKQPQPAHAATFNTHAMCACDEKRSIKSDPKKLFTFFPMPTPTAVAVPSRLLGPWTDDEPRAWGPAHGAYGPFTEMERARHHPTGQVRQMHYSPTLSSGSRSARPAVTDKQRSQHIYSLLVPPSQRQDGHSMDTAALASTLAMHRLMGVADALSLERGRGVRPVTAGSPPSMTRGYGALDRRKIGPVATHAGVSLRSYVIPPLGDDEWWVVLVGWGVGARRWVVGGRWW